MSVTIFDIIASEQSPEERRWQNPDHLICPSCGEHVRPEPPAYWRPTDGPLPQFSHPDGEPLCPVPADAGYRPTEPVVAKW